MQIEIDEQSAEEIRELANLLEKTPEKTAEEAVAYGMHMLRRYAYYKERSETVDVAEVLKNLRNVGGDNPPDPDDEIPDDLKYLLDERRA